MLSKELYRTYVQILKDELVPAMGCTEPIAIAYAGAVARKTLGPLPERVEVAVSRNIIKNVKSVVVPHTGGLRGIEAAAAAGIVAGDAAKELEVISHVEQEDIEAMGTFLKEVPCSVCEASSDLIFDIQITLYHGEDRRECTDHRFPHESGACVQKRGDSSGKRDYRKRRIRTGRQIDAYHRKNLCICKGSGSCRCPGSTGTSGSLQHGDRRGRAPR